MPPDCSRSLFSQGHWCDLNHLTMVCVSVKWDNIDKSLAEPMVCDKHIPSSSLLLPGPLTAYHHLQGRDSTPWTLYAKALCHLALPSTPLSISGSLTGFLHSSFFQQPTSSWRLSTTLSGQVCANLNFTHNSCQIYVYAFCMDFTKVNSIGLGLYLSDKVLS